MGGGCHSPQLGVYLDLVLYVFLTLRAYGDSMINLCHICLHSFP